LDVATSETITLTGYAGYSVLSRHQHDEGTYDAESHNHSVSIGDAVSDAASVNGTQLTADLQRLESGTWVSHYSQNIDISVTTYGTDVDLTNSGTYPDDSGFWRVVLTTNNASADLLKGVVKVKHQMDN